MPYPEARVESSLPQLGSVLHASLAQPALIEFLRRSLQIRAPACAVGLPRRLGARVFQRFLGAPHVRIQLGQGALFDASFCQLALPAEQALALVDRVLGGKGNGLVPGRAALPSAAECGVLAYFAARCAQAMAADLRVQDVEVGFEEAALSGALLWPVRVSAGDDLKLDLKLIFASAACAPRAPVRARLSLIDSFTHDALAALEAGDLLLGEGWSLHDTLSGPSGLLELSVMGSSERAMIALEAGTLRLIEAAPAPRAGPTAELVVAQLDLDFATLAGLLEGDSMRCPELGEATLEIEQRTLARGRLLRFAGQLALEVIDHSMR